MEEVLGTGGSGGGNGGSGCDVESGGEKGW